MKRQRSDHGLYVIESQAWLVGKRCARCGTDQNLTVHHMAGREGPLLRDQRHWLPLCLSFPLRCHDWVEHHKEEAARLGWIYEFDPRTNTKTSRVRIQPR